MKRWDKQIILIVIIIAASLVGILAVLEYGPQSVCSLCPLPAQNTVTESLVLVSHSMYSSTNMTLNLRNTRSLAWQVDHYYVTDNNGNQYWRPSWTGPAGSPNIVVSVPVTIGASCGSCSYQGTPGAFSQFTPGSTYTLNIVTSRNNLFPFTVTAQ
jgi:hypothetical protein